VWRAVRQSGAATNSAGDLQSRGGGEFFLGLVFLMGNIRKDISMVKKQNSGAFCKMQLDVRFSLAT
jgi:hypothetical protein